MTSASESPETVDLAREPDFRLGGLFVSPSAARVRGAAGEQRVEPRVMEVLVVLARHAGRTVTRDQLIDACWGGRIVSDDAVSRVIAQVRALARSFEPAPFDLETLPKLGFRLTAEVSPVVPGGAPPTGAHPPAAAAARQPVRRGVMIAVGAGALLLVLLAVGAAVLWRASGPSRSPSQNGRIEVMAFATRDADPELQKVAADTSESIVRGLAGGGAQVAERPLPRDAARSDAELRIAGTVERENANFVVNAQILDLASGLVLWTDRFVQTAEQRRTSPGDVSSAISALLHCALEDRKHAHTPISAEAFGLYINACAGVFVGDDGWGRMLGATRRLVKIAPQFADAHAMRSIAAANMAGEMEHSPAQAASLRAESKAAAELALRLDPKTPKAYSGLALNEGVLDGRFPKNWFLIERYLQKAMTLDPDLPLVHNEYATLLRSTGRVNEAVELLRNSDFNDARSGGDPRVAILLASSGDLAGAEAMLKSIEATSRVSMNSVRWMIAFWWADPKTALTTLRTLGPGDRPKEQVDCLERYLEQLAGKVRMRGLPAACAKIDANWRVRLLAREGDVDAAFAELKPPLPGGTLLLYYPEMRAVRRDPRFWPLARSMGLVDYWRKSGHWPDFCAEPDLPFDCRKATAAF